jgi:hypothetical protein
MKPETHANNIQLADLPGDARAYCTGTVRECNAQNSLTAVRNGNIN